MWADRRQGELPHVEFLTDRRLREGLSAAKRNGFDLAIIDTPPAAGSEALTAAEAADLSWFPAAPGSGYRRDPPDCAACEVDRPAGLCRNQCRPTQRDNISQTRAALFPRRGSRSHPWSCVSEAPIGLPGHSERE